MTTKPKTKAMRLAEHIDMLMIWINEYDLPELKKYLPKYQSELLRLDAENKRLKKKHNAYRSLVHSLEQQRAELKKGHAGALESAQTLQSERDANAILTAENDQLRAQVERLQGGEPVPVEIWRNDRKVNIYPGDNVLRVWGLNETEMSEAPFTLEAVQSAIDWLYTSQPAASAMVALTDEQIDAEFQKFRCGHKSVFAAGVKAAEARHGIGQPAGGEG